MEERNNICPICPRGCQLSSPRCGRGEEYARTGNMPEASKRHGSGQKERLQFFKKEQQLVMKYLHHAVGVADRGGFTQDMAEEMFSVLNDGETETLCTLLEKLSDYWMAIAPVKPEHSGHRPR